jgi:lysophospholipase L1-like esterase
VSLRSFCHVFALAALVAALAGAGAAHAVVNQSVLILDSTVIGGASSDEANAVRDLGLNPVVVDDATWQSLSISDFASYRAVILGDGACNEVRPAAAEANAAIWSAAATGNVVIVGTDPVYHVDTGGPQLTKSVVSFVVADPDKTGLYLSLSCYYHDQLPTSDVPLLEGLGPGEFTVTGVGCYDDAHIVAVHPALADLTDATLSNWSCSVHEAFSRWPTTFQVLALARDFGSAFTASDGTVGTPYILARGAGLRTFPLSVSPIEQELEVGQTASLTAELLDGVTQAPVAGTALHAAVFDGSGSLVQSLSCGAPTCATDASGHVTFTYAAGVPRTDVVTVWIDGDGNGSPDKGEPTVVAEVRWTPGTVPTALNAVVLGDDFASGEGTYSYAAGEKCHRSERTWAASLDTLASRLNVVGNVACSGAKAGDLLTTGYRGELAQTEQLRQLAATKRVDVVLVTVGANDLSFGKELSKCFAQKGPSCTSDLQRLERRSPDVAAALAQSVLPAVQAAAPGAKVVVVGYPRLFPDTEAEATTCATLSGAEQLEANRLAAQLRTDWQAAAQAVGALYVDSYDTFDGHELCTAAGSWLNPFGTKGAGAAEEGHPTSGGYAGWGGTVATSLRGLGLDIG